jgi:lipopolysaccharide biosynthesis regulator YciM
MPTESTFLLAGLFIIAAAAGWAFARFNRGNDATAPISADYIRGLNLVLNRKTDEALELFVRMAEVDDETLETHFALGHLFRRRGEVDRAIRVHQNLLARPNLSEDQRDQALFALGEDYLGAGLFDRAEKLFGDLSDSPSHGEPAQQHLLSIYEREQDWKRALEVSRKLDSRVDDSERIAHYQCELAEKARREGDLTQARAYLKPISRGRQGSNRGILIRAAIATEEEDFDTAVRLFHRVLETDGYLIAEILHSLVDSHRRRDSLPELQDFLSKLMLANASLEADIAVAAILSNMLDEPVLYSAVEAFILHNDTLSSLVDLAHLTSLDTEPRRAVVTRIAGGLRRLAMGSARYRCIQCGYSTRRFIWNCPGCKAWETVRPVNRIQFEGLLFTDDPDTVKVS